MASVPFALAYLATSRDDDQRPSCSPATRRGASPRTSPSCRRGLLQKPRASIDPHFRYDLNYGHFAGLRSLTLWAISGLSHCGMSEQVCSDSTVSSSASNVQSLVARQRLSMRWRACRYRPIFYRLTNLSIAASLKASGHINTLRPLLTLAQAQCPVADILLDFAREGEAG
jgi:hypothetical protein